MIDRTLKERQRNIGNFNVGRILPFGKRRTVGPFIFVDHMGPAELPAGEGMDVLSHPHIGLATVTYLFEGVVTHRDSLGVEQDIRPGEVNWMTAGSGITHSERTPPEARATDFTMHGMQVWVAFGFGFASSFTVTEKAVILLKIDTAHQISHAYIHFFLTSLFSASSWLCTI